MTDRPPYLLRPVRAEDREALIAVHNATYAGDRGHGMNPMDGRVWDWRYGVNGTAHASSVAEDRETSEIAAYVGGIARHIWMRGELTGGIQSLDLMTAPSRSQGLRRVGVFGRLVRYWCDCNFSADDKWIAFGFPSTAAFRIGRRFGGYRLYRPVNVLVHSSPAKLRDRSAGLELRTVECVSPDVDGLWNRCARDIELAVVRNAEYFSWRYERHPRFAYRMVEARDRGGALRGLLVTRHGAVGQDVTMLMDWLAPLDDEDAIRALLAACAGAAREAGAGSVVAWFPEGQPWFERFQDEGFRVRFTSIIHVGRSWKREFPVEDIRRAIYATCGDIEYY
ncbi:MAG: hypothetical protein AB1726_15875 [Planctomycetota bacterium]